MGMVPNGNTNIPQKKPVPTTTTTTTSTETPETTTENVEETTEAENGEIAQPSTSENVEQEPKRDSGDVTDFDVKDNDTFVNSDGDFKNNSEDGDENESDDGEIPDEEVDEEDDEEDVEETESASSSDETVAVPVSDDVQDMAIETVQQFLDSAATEATSNDTPAKPANLDALELPSLEPDSTVSSLEQDSSVPVVLLQSVVAPKEAESSSTQDLSDKTQLAKDSDEVVTENPEHEVTVNDQLPKSDDVVMVNENLQEMSSNDVVTEEVSETGQLVKNIEAPGDATVATEKVFTEVEAPVDEEQAETASYLLQSNESASDVHALPADVSVEAQSAPDLSEALEPPQATRMSGETAESEQSPATEAINDNPATDSVTDAAEKNDPLSVVESSYSTPVQEEDPAVATPANDQLLPTSAETREQPNESVQGDAPSKAGAEGSLFDKALSWLGLSESEEVLQVQKTVTTPSPLQEQIASMDPNSYRADQLHDEVPLPDAADTLFDVTTPSSIPVDGFCHKDDELCRKAQDQVVHTDGSSSHDGHSH